MHTIHPKWDISNFQYSLGQIGWIVCTLGRRPFSIVLKITSDGKSTENFYSITSTVTLLK